MASTSPPIQQALRRSRIFTDCDDAVLTRLATASVHRSVRRGAAIFHAGERAVFLAIINTGLVKIVRRSAEEMDSIVALFGPRETIGNVAVAARGPYPADAVAATDEVGVVCVSADAINELMPRSCCLACAMNRSLVEHTQALQAKIEIMSAGSVDRRLAALLFHLLERFGDVDGEGAHFIPVVLSRGDLASIVGATIETTIRTMSRWQKTGVVETTRSGFRVPDLARLRSGGHLPAAQACPAA